MNICESKSCKNIYEHNYEWEIENWMQYRIEFSSPSLITVYSHHFKYEWHLQLGVIKYDSDRVFLKLEVKCNYLTNECPLSNQIKKIGYTFPKALERSSHVQTVDKICNNFSMKFEKVCYYLPNAYYKHLTVIFSIHDVNDETDLLRNNLEKLLLSGEWSDFKIIIDKKTFFVHKNILTARSDYFSAMLKHGTKEQCENEVEFSDVRCEIMNEMLRFMYCGEVNITEELSYDILTAADTYQMEDLKTKCEKEILRNLRIENIAKCMTYVDHYDNETLKQGIINFLKKYSCPEIKDADTADLKSFITSAVSSSFLRRLICELIKIEQ